MYKRFLVFLIILFVSKNSPAEEFIWHDISRSNRNIRSILTIPGVDKIIFAASGADLLKSTDGGYNWRRVFSIRGAHNINSLKADLADPNIIFAASDSGLYRSRNLGANWERIFRGKNSFENHCNDVISFSGNIFVGTKAGLFISRDAGRNFLKEDTGTGREIFNLDAYGRKNNFVIYISAENGAFKSSDNAKSWEKIFLNYSRESKAQDETKDQESIGKIYGISFIKADKNNINVLYLCGVKGVFKSNDRGLTWQKLSEYGLFTNEIKMLALSEYSQVFVLTKSGIFEYQDERWKEISFTLPAGQLNYIVLDSKGKIYATGENGIYMSEAATGENYQGMLEEYIKDEPRIEEVRQQAIKYAEVSPEKILQWRKGAAKKALLPQVSVGVDRNSSDLWHWEGGSTTKLDDDVLRRGRDAVDWDISLTWDLSNVIWNEDQTSIDVRSKLMVELRQDILDQVNKLYFERLRIKAELDNLAIEDRTKRFEKQLKLEELKASLDSLTAGYYSAQLQKLASNRQLN